MKRADPFHDYIVSDLFLGISGIRSKAMFGGWGIYKDEKFFAIIADGELYLKVDKNTKKLYQQHGSHPFVYSKKDGKEYEMSYWSLPEKIAGDKEELIKWVLVACNIKAGKRKS